jgi:hypothetical protein
MREERRDLMTWIPNRQGNRLQPGDRAELRRDIHSREGTMLKGTKVILISASDSFLRGTYFKIMDFEGHIIENVSLNLLNNTNKGSI